MQLAVVWLIVELEGLRAQSNHISDVCTDVPMVLVVIRFWQTMTSCFNPFVFPRVAFMNIFVRAS